MFRRLKDLIIPFSGIAQELRILRELYEMDLASRNPPLVRITEEPRRADTEITYMGDEPKPKSALRRLLEEWESEEPEPEQE
jgi:hypothetical protein